MARGRKRKSASGIPTHIDPNKVPRGLYWHVAGRFWYAFAIGDNGRRTTKRMAGSEATMVQLYEIAELRKPQERRTVEWMMLQYENHDRFKRLAQATQRSYSKSRRIVCKFRTANGQFGDLLAVRINRPVLQRLIDEIGKGSEKGDNGELIPTPTKARQAKSYLSVVFKWGANRGYVAENYAAELEVPVEVKNHGMPTEGAHDRMVAFCRTNARDPLTRPIRGESGSTMPYLWAGLEIAYLCRLRSIELIELTDADISEEGIRCVRRKGSNANITEWSSRLRAAVEYLLECRKAIWTKRKFPTPMSPAARPLMVTITGGKLTQGGFNSAWNRARREAIEQGVIGMDERFKLHGLKHRGITDTDGTLEDVQQASGHKSRQMAGHYVHKLRKVKPVH